MQMARKVAEKIICRIVVTNSFTPSPPELRVLVKIKPFNIKAPIFNLSFPTLAPTHCIHIVNVDVDTGCPKRITLYIVRST